MYRIPRRCKRCLEEICSIPSILKIPRDFGQVFKARHFLGDHSLCCSGHLHLQGVHLAGYPGKSELIPQSCNLKSVRAVLWSYSRCLEDVALYVKYSKTSDCALGISERFYLQSLFPQFSSMTGIRASVISHRHCVIFNICVAAQIL